MVNQQTVSFINPSNELSCTFLSKKFDLQANEDFMHYISKERSKGEFISANDDFDIDSCLLFNNINGLQNAGEDARYLEDKSSLPYCKEDVMDYLGLKPSRALQTITSPSYTLGCRVNFATERRNCTVPISSPLGALWLKNTSRGTLKNPGKKLKYIEKHCQSSSHLRNRRLCGMVSLVKDWPCTGSGSSSPIVQWSHTYCFSKQQRKEKEKQLRCLATENTEHRLNSCVKLETLKELRNLPKVNPEHNLKICSVRLEKLKELCNLPKVNTDHRLKMCSVSVEKLKFFNAKTLDLLKICQPLRVLVEKLQISGAPKCRRLQECRPCKVVIERLD